jgi:Kdo2-lipid IVA lauroyltransferase/acyltransferase
LKTLFRVLALVPLPVLHAAGAALGWIAFLASPTYRRRFLDNARQAGYDFFAVRQAISEAGKLVTEVPRVWFGRPLPVQWEGVELVRNAHAAGRGVILMTPHIGCFEIAAQAYARHAGHITVLYRRASKSYLRDLIDTGRARDNLAAAPATLAGVRQLLKALKSGQAIGLLPDQVPPAGQGAWAPFFGRLAYTMTLSTKLVHQTGCDIVLVRVERLSWGRGYHVYFSPWTAMSIPQDPVAAATLVNRVLEGVIRECPQQYLWGYARYKPPRGGDGSDGVQ